MGGRAHRADERSERTSGRADGRADGRTSGQGQTPRADERTGVDNGRTGGRADGADGLADWRTGRRANGGGTGGRRISEGKTPDLTLHLTWPWEIQRGRPRVTVKLPHLPPPSR